MSIVSIEVTPSELSAGVLSAQHQEAAVRALREDGIVVLAGVVSPQSISALLEKSLEDVQALLARPDSPFNWTKGNIQQDPPPFPPYLFRDVLVNDIVIGVTKAILGPGLKCGFYSGNTALESESRQPVHADEGQLWPDMSLVHPAHSLVVNVPLVDMGPINGSTEMWPGTHLDPAVAVQDGDIEVSDAKLAAQRASRPPLQPEVKAGSVVIRDIRMWHAGMPNRTPNPRPMIAMIHSVSWWPSGKVRFAAGSEEFLQHPDLKWNAEFVEGAIDHIGGVGGYKADEAV